jgi:hypothetical protein
VRLRGFACALAVGAIAAAGTAAPGRGVTVPRCGKVLPPASGAYLGAAFGRGAGTPQVAAFERRAQHRLTWAAFTQQWSKGLAFPREQVVSIWRRGAVPSIAFLPTSSPYVPGRSADGPESRYSLERIVAGDFDRQLGAWAEGARRLGLPVMLSFGADVNEDWGPWNARWNGEGATEGYGDITAPDGAERYRDAFRHLVTLFRAKGATNVAFVFPAGAAVDGPDWNALRLYYPGDAYVDWLGISVDGSFDAETPAVPFARRLAGSDAYATLARLSRRPVAVTMGTVDDAAHGKPAWIRDAFRTLRSGRYPRVQAVTWREADGAGATRIESSPAAQTAFRNGVAGSFFSGHARFAGDCRPPPPTEVSAHPVRIGVIRVRWSPVGVASSYEVYRDGRLLATTRETTWLDTTAGQARRHTYAVRAVDLGGRSV